MSKSTKINSSFDFVTTPPQAPADISLQGCGVKQTTAATIHNPTLPADGPGADSFNGRILLALLLGVPMYLAWKVGGGWKATVFFAIVSSLPILISWWLVISVISPRKTAKVKLPGRPVEFYLNFRKEDDKARYRSRNKIPMDLFAEMYFDGDVEFKGDALEILEYRHDWASFPFTLRLVRFFLFSFVPEMIMHTRSQDEEQVRDHYDRGDDFYGWFLGPRMIYTSGIISDPSREETLEELQDNKLAVVCEKVGLKKNEKMLDVGCGWGTLTRFASENYGARVTGITLGRNQTAWGNSAMRKVGIPEEQSKVFCMDYRDIPVPEGGYDKIICLEMAEHVGVRHYSGFARQMYSMLDDDGVFFLQYAGLRKAWQYEDLIWGLFMNKYIFPGADASTPLGWVVDQLEGAGFEIKSVDTIGIHYSATLWRWYRNWIANRDRVVAKYGRRWFRIWEYFLAISVIASRQGTATCFQITMVKNINSTHRIEGIASQFGLSGALKNCRVDLQAWAAKNNVTSSAEFT